MVAHTDPQIFRLSQNKPMLMMMLMQSQEEEVQPDEDMDSNVPTITMPPADLDIADPLSQEQPETTIEIMEIADDSDVDVAAADELITMDVVDECELIEYQEEDDMMMEMDNNHSCSRCQD